jgi:signal peptidase I
MFSFFLPRYVKEGKAFLKNARKLLHYKRDLLSEATIADFETQMEKLEKALHDRDRRAAEEEAMRLDKLAGAFAPPAEDAAWRENCEVFLVAIVIAVGVRAYFLQPFTIPTNSMYPTLNGIIGHATPEPPPNFFVRFFDGVLHGRTYVDVVAKGDETITRVREFKSLLPFVNRTPLVSNFGLFTRTEIVTDQNVYVVQGPETAARELIHTGGYGLPIPGGEPIARGYIDAGDHVFVDKCTYNFRTPHRSEVFVFKTNGITGIEEDLRGRGITTSEFYIKRVAGLPEDELRIDAPNLFVNGKLAEEPGFRRVMSLAGDYRGYANQARTTYLTRPESRYRVRDGKYLALGDNSYNSADSRYWGPVPQENIMGRGIFVYWPFMPHFGLIQ